MAEMDNLIGSHLSLISQQDVRYDGILFSINSKESSIVLRDVKCFGTEDRVKEEYKKIPPNSNVLAFVTFPGNEIKDLSVFETDDKPAAKEPEKVEEAPKKTNTTTNSSSNNKQATAPKSYASTTKGEQPKQQSSNASKPSTQHQSATTGAAKSNNKNDDHVFTKAVGGNQQNNKKPAVENKPHTTTSAADHSKPKPTSTAGTGEHLAKLRLKGADTEGVANLTGEFDFNEGLSHFNKSEVLAKVASESAAEKTEKVEVKYVKDDFFDMLSNDATGGKGHTGFNRQEERVLNQDTFGAIAVQQSYRRGGYHGRGRGGGGRGGGRGRGGNTTGRGGGRGGSGSSGQWNKSSAPVASS